MSSWLLSPDRLPPGTTAASREKLPPCLPIPAVPIRLPLAVWLAWPMIELPGGWGSVAGWGLGVYGAWLAMAADLAARGLAMLVIFRRAAWSRVAV